MVAPVGCGVALSGAALSGVAVMGGGGSLLGGPGSASLLQLSANATTHQTRRLARIGPCSPLAAVEAGGFPPPPRSAYSTQPVTLLAKDSARACPGTSR